MAIAALWIGGRGLVSIAPLIAAAEPPPSAPALPQLASLAPYLPGIGHSDASLLPFFAGQPLGSPAPASTLGSAAWRPPLAARGAESTPIRLSAEEIMAMTSGIYPTGVAMLRRVSWGPRAVPAAAQPPTWIVPAAPLVSNVDTRRWTGSAWLFARGSGGQRLATGGQLGGSQAGARIAYRLDPLARRPLALAARLSSPLDTIDGAEAAIGIDWHPLPGQSLRLSAERRIAIGDDARNAWSLYAAGGFYKAVRGVEIDGYGQAGIVGVHTRDLFADGALRIAKPIAAGDGKILRVGAGIWGAAQPGAERLDIGPGAALTLPVAGTKATATVALDWRIRIAGEARPGSGAALTLAFDF